MLLNNDDIWVDVVRFDSCALPLLALTNAIDQNETGDSRYLKHINTTPKLTLEFVHGITLTLSIEADEIICNIACNLNVWEEVHDNCSSYNLLSALVQGRLPVCHNQNYSVNINITLSSNGMIYPHNEAQIISQCRGKLILLYSHCCMGWHALNGLPLNWTCKFGLQLRCINATIRDLATPHMHF